MCLEKQSLWWTGIHKLIGQTAAESAGFGKDFLSGILIKSKHQFLMLKRTQVGYIVLIENENYSSSWPEQIKGPCAGFGIQFLATDSQQVPLEEAIGQQNKDNLIDDHVEGT